MFPRATSPALKDFLLPNVPTQAKVLQSVRKCGTQCEDFGMDFVAHQALSEDDFLKQVIFYKTKLNEKTGCWEWQGAHTRGYGTIMRRRKVVRVTKASYELWCGLVPKGLLIRHACDNPCCVNPTHLSVGTQKQNMQDKVARGRQGHRLNREAVAFIRASSASSQFLADLYGVNPVAINRVRTGETWPQEAGTRKTAGKGFSAATGRAPQQKLTVDQVLAIKASALSTKELATAYAVDRKSITNIKSGATWGHVTR